MLNQINKKIKFFDQQIIQQNTTKDVKGVPEGTGSDYLASLYSTNSTLTDNYIQLIMYFI